jgi:hypothetical protein
MERLAASIKNHFFIFRGPNHMQICQNLRTASFMITIKFYAAYIRKKGHAVAKMVEALC